jgi:probable HAF family extracellular repeat protein
MLIRSKLARTHLPERIMKPVERFLAAAFLVVVTACGSTDSTAPATPPIPTAAKLSLNRSSQTVVVGQATVLTATVLGTDGRVFTGGAVTWVVSDPTVASISSSDSSGSRSATVLGIRTGSVLVTASITASILASAGIDVAPATIIDAPGEAFVYTEADGMQMIPPPSGATVMAAYAVNDSGRVAGSAYFGSSSNHAFIWSKGDGFRDLGGMPGSSTVVTVALAINKNGQVAGWGRATDGNNHAFRWTAATGMTDLGLLPGATQSVALGINGRGEVVGYSLGADGERPFRWTEELGMQDMSKGGSVTGQALAINEDGQIAGALMLPDDPYDFASAVVWNASGAMVDVIRCLYQTNHADGCGAGAVAINKDGTVVGTNGQNAIIWTSATGVQTLSGVPAGDFASSATGINDSGTVVGNLYGTSGQRNFGFIWSVAGGYRSVPLPAGRHFMQLTGISNRGLIVGWTQ